jgi:cbb3-type cytochrome oxidase subunit 3
MTYIIFLGDMFVMAFMIGVVIWVSLNENRKTIEESARIPLEDEGRNG